jgi:hypothetical protein
METPHGMTKHISALCLSFILYLPVGATQADAPFHIQYDTVIIQRRSFDRKILEEFKSDPDYQYGRPRQGLTLLQRVMIWIAMALAWLFQFLAETVLGQIIFYGLCAGLILYVVLKVLNIDARDLFYRTRASTRIDFGLAEGNIHELDFEKLINDAIQGKEYRDGVRLLFLYSLKKLSDAHLIQWMPGKTNDEYMKELQRHPAKPRLQELRYYFDYTWYGHFEISGQTFAGVHQTFREFDASLV